MKEVELNKDLKTIVSNNKPTEVTYQVAFHPLLDTLKENEEYVLCKREKPLYVNSLGEKFYGGEKVYFYSFNKNKIFVNNTNSLSQYAKVNLATEIAKSELSALKLAVKQLEEKFKNIK